MKSLLTSIFIITISLQIFCQELNLPNEIKNYEKKEKKYINKAKDLIKKDLIENNIYNSLSASNLVNNMEYLIIPMFKMKLDSTLDYSTINNLLNSLELDNKLLFHQIVMFRERDFMGVYTCNDLGSGGVSLYSEMPNLFNNLIIDVNNIKSLNFKLVFYVKGILHTWWIVQEDKLIVYSLSDRKFYEPQLFLYNNYTDEKLKRIITFLK